MPSSTFTLNELLARIEEQGGVGGQAYSQIRNAILLLNRLLANKHLPDEGEWGMLFHDKKLRELIQFTVESHLTQSKEKAVVAPKMGDDHATMLFGHVSDSNPLGV